MPGPNDFHFDEKGNMQSGLGLMDPRNGTKTYVEPPRDGRSREAKLAKAAKEIDEAREKLDADIAAFEAKKKAGG